MANIILEIVGVFNPSPLSGGTLQNSLSQLFCWLSLLGNLQSTISLCWSELAAHGDGGTCSDSEAGGVPHGGDDSVDPLLSHLDISGGWGVTPSSGSGGGDVTLEKEWARYKNKLQNKNKNHINVHIVLVAEVSSSTQTYNK